MEESASQERLTLEETRSQHDQFQDETYTLFQISALLERIGVINEAETDAQAITQTMALICELTGWQSGRGVLVDQNDPDLNEHQYRWPISSAGLPALPDGKIIYKLPVSIDDLTNLQLLFYSDRSEKPSKSLEAIMTAISRRLGVNISRRKAIAQLQANEEHLRQLVESVKDFAFFTLDADGNISSWNTGAEKIKGYQQHEIIGKHFSIFYTPEAIAAGKPQLALNTAQLEGRYDIEDWRVRKDGSLFWADVVLFPIYSSSGALRGYTKLTRDLTKRKLMEKELQENQLRHQQETTELRRRLMEGREAERLHMAQELHDGPIQDLYGLIFSIDAISARIRSQAALQLLGEMRTQLQEMVGTLRSMMGNLRPPTIAPFGLEKAIRSHLQSFRQAHPEYRIHLDLDADRRTLPEDLRLALYRIYQSSLSNIVRHAEASEISIRLKLEDESVHLEIQDNGIGFDVPERWIRLARSGHLGLVGAQERAEAIGGTFAVESKPGEGTCVKIVVPRSLGNDHEARV